MKRKSSTASMYCSALTSNFPLRKKLSAGSNPIARSATMRARATRSNGSRGHSDDGVASRLRLNEKSARASFSSGLSGSQNSSTSSSEMSSTPNSASMPDAAFMSRRSTEKKGLVSSMCTFIPGCGLGVTLGQSDLSGTEAVASMWVTTPFSSTSNVYVKSAVRTGNENSRRRAPRSGRR